jgi:hypothetical protein
MDGTKKIHFITNLKVKHQKTDHCNLLMMEVKGYSDSEQLGIARLEPAISSNLISKDGFLELDFIIHPIKNSCFQRRDWNICPIFRFDEMPKELKGVKVMAEANAELIIIEA